MKHVLLLPFPPGKGRGEGSDAAPAPPAREPNPPGPLHEVRSSPTIGIGALPPTVPWAGNPDQHAQTILTLPVVARRAAPRQSRGQQTGSSPSHRHTAPAKAASLHRTPRIPAARARWPALLLTLLLPACTLIDQNTFRPGAGNAPVIPPASPAPITAPAFPGPPPLLVLQPGQPAADPLRQAVAAARARKPGVAFDVVAILPGTPTPEATRRATLDAAEVARAITAQGVPPANVRVLARPEPTATVGDIRIYVR